MKTRITTTKGTHFPGDKILHFKGKRVSYSAYKRETVLLSKKHGRIPTKKVLGIEHIKTRPSKPLGMSLSELGKAAKIFYKLEDARKVKYHNTKHYQGRKMLQRELARAIDKR